MDDFLFPKAPKHNRIKAGVFRDEKWLDQIRSQEMTCAISGLPSSPDDQIVCMHIGTSGMAIKSPDNECIPARNNLHLKSHSQRGCMSAHNFWIEVLNEDPRLLNDVLKAWAREYYREHKK